MFFIFVVALARQRHSFFSQFIHRLRVWGVGRWVLVSVFFYYKMSSTIGGRKRLTPDKWKMLTRTFFSLPYIKLNFLHLQDLLKVINNVFYSFSKSHFVLELFRFVWYLNEINYDVKLCTDYCKLLENWYCLILVCWDAFSRKVLRDFV